MPSINLSNDSVSQTQRKRRRAATVAALAIFASSAQARTIVVQPPNLDVHYLSDPLPAVTASKELPVEYYPPDAVAPATSRTKVKPQINKKKVLTKKAHESHSPWHTGEYLPQRLGSSNKIDSTQVILRPRTSNTALSTSKDGKMIYYYDPSSLTSSVESPTLTLPEVIYDANGNVKKLEDVHDGGKNEVYLEVKPKAVWGEKWQSTLKSKLHGGSGTSSSNNTMQSSDQIIVFGTIATMAVLVGMLSANRLRSKRLLEHCMESDLDDEWDEKKNDAPRGSLMQRGFGDPMGGRRENYGSGLHWRGDMEKFDV